MEEIGKLIFGFLVGVALGNVVYRVKEAKSTGEFFFYFILSTVIVIAIVSHLELL